MLIVNAAPNILEAIINVRLMPTLASRPYFATILCTLVTDDSENRSITALGAWRNVRSRAKLNAPCLHD
jgi:hypothetical protein